MDNSGSNVPMESPEIPGGGHQSKKENLLLEFLSLKRGLEQRLAHIHRSGEMQAEIGGIQYYLTAMDDMSSFTVQQIQSFIDNIRAMHMRNPLPDLSVSMHVLSLNSSNEFGGMADPPSASSAAAITSTSMIPWKATPQGAHATVEVSYLSKKDNPKRSETAVVKYDGGRRNGCGGNVYNNGTRGRQRTKAVGGGPFVSHHHRKDDQRPNNDCRNNGRGRSRFNCETSARTSGFSFDNSLSPQEARVKDWLTGAPLTKTWNGPDENFEGWPTKKSTDTSSPVVPDIRSPRGWFEPHRESQERDVQMQIAQLNANLFGMRVSSESRGRADNMFGTFDHRGQNGQLNDLGHVSQDVVTSTSVFGGQGGLNGRNGNAEVPQTRKQICFENIPQTSPLPPPPSTGAPTLLNPFIIISTPPPPSFYFQQPPPVSLNHGNAAILYTQLGPNLNNRNNETLTPQLLPPWNIGNAHGMLMLPPPPLFPGINPPSLTPPVPNAPNFGTFPGLPNPTTLPQPINFQQPPPTFNMIYPFQVPPRNGMTDNNYPKQN